MEIDTAENTDFPCLGQTCLAAEAIILRNHTGGLVNEFVAQLTKEIKGCQKNFTLTEDKNKIQLPAN